SALADSKANQIEAYARERRRDVSALAKVRSVIEALEKLNKVFPETQLSDEQKYRQVLAEVRPYLKEYCDAFGYSDLFLFNAAEVKVLAVHADEDLGANYAEPPRRERQLGQVIEHARMLM